MNVWFRCDASIEIGNGHLIRCLTLAASLEKKGCSIGFICRKLEGSRFELITSKGYKLIQLSQTTESTSNNNNERKLAHSHWLPCSWQLDAQETINHLEHFVTKQVPIDFLIIDHYALDKRWQQQLAPYCNYSLAIDDLADRAHIVDILVDQSPGRTGNDYDSLLPKGKQRLCGTQFALLREEFTHLPRQYQQLQSFTVLISMGGIDYHNISQWLLDALAPLAHLPIKKIVVLLSQSAVHINSLKQTIADYPIPIKLEIEPPSVAAVLQHVDIAIGAPGGSSLERCAMAIPSLLIITADNQINNAKHLDAKGAAINLGDFTQLDSVKFQHVFSNFINNPNKLNAMSSQALQLCDGKGTKRVVDAMFDLAFEVEAAKTSDRELLFKWQTAPNIRQFARITATPSYEEHCLWFDKVMADEHRQLMIFKLASTAVGMLRFDKLDTFDKNKAWEISILVAPEFQGKGVAKMALEWAKKCKFTPIIAEVNANNIASQTLFSHCGFQRIDAEHFRFSNK